MDCIHQGLHIIFFGDVAHISVHVGNAGSRIVVESALQRRFVNIVKDNILYSGLGVCLRYTETDAMGRSGNPGILTFKRKGVYHIQI